MRSSVGSFAFLAVLAAVDLAIAASNDTNTTSDAKNRQRYGQMLAGDSGEDVVSIAAADPDYTCSKTKKCEKGCCGSM